MESKNNKKKSKLTVANINKVFGASIFVLAFIFTFLITSKELRPHAVILLAVFIPVIVATGIAWLVTYLVIKKKKDKADPNKQKINKALEKLEEEKKKDESNSTVL